MSKQKFVFHTSREVKTVVKINAKNSVVKISLKSYYNGELYFSETAQKFGGWYGNLSYAIELLFAESWDRCITNAYYLPYGHKLTFDEIANWKFDTRNWRIWALDVYIILLHQVGQHEEEEELREIRRKM